MADAYGYSIASTKRLRACMKCHLIKTEEEVNYSLYYI